MVTSMPGLASGGLWQRSNRMVRTSFPTSLSQARRRFSSSMTKATLSGPRQPKRSSCRRNNAGGCPPNWNAANPARLVRYVLHHVHDHIRISIEDDQVRANHAAPVFRRKRRQFPFEFHRTRLNPLLQSRRECAVPFELFLEARRQISPAFREPRRKV